MTRYVYQKTGDAVLRVLAENNVAVTLPDQGCCGIPAWAAGDKSTARELAVRNVESLLRLNPDYIITDCASCGDMLKRYPELLGDRAAREFSARVQDISYFLVRTSGFRRQMDVNPLVVIYHDPCHLRRGQGVYVEPREILSLQEMAGPDTCCGSAGSFSLTHYDLSMKVLGRKVDSILATGAGMVVTGCPACRLQIEHGLRERGKMMPVAAPGRTTQPGLCRRLIAG